MLQNTPDRSLAMSWHFAWGLDTLLNGGKRSYIQVPFDFIQDFIKKPVFAGPLHYFPYFSSPTLWIPPVFGIDGKVFSRTILAWQFHGARTILHEQRRHLPEHGLQHILSIYLH